MTRGAVMWVVEWQGWVRRWEVSDTEADARRCAAYLHSLGFPAVCYQL